MTGAQWMLILLLAVASYGVRLAGLIGGRAMSANPRLKPFLNDLPGCLVVGLVAASLAGEPALTWIAGLVALAVAILVNNVVMTMVTGLLAITILQQLALS